MTEQWRGGTPYVSVEGAKLEDDKASLLVDVRVEQSLHLPDSVTLRFVDHEFRLFDSELFEISKKVKVEFQVGETKKKVIDGEITAISVEQGPDGKHELVVFGMDKSHRLHRGVKVRTHQDTKDSQAVEEAVSDYGLGKDVSATAATNPYLMQHQSDADFLSDRAHANGLGWWVEDGDVKFAEQKAEGGPRSLEWGDNLLKFQVRLSAGESVKEAEVRGWDPATQEPFSGTYEAKHTSDELGSTADAAEASSRKAGEFNGKRLGVAAPVIDKSEADTLAKSVVERGAAEQVTVHGEARGDPAIHPGIYADIKGVGGKLSGNYLLTRVEHVWGDKRPYGTRFQCGGRRAGGLVDLLSHDSGSSDLGSKMLIGVVTDLNDPEGQGRVRVKYPAISDDDEGAWARLLMPGAGNERGMVFHPEVQDEVLVAFEHGDLRRPVVLGGLWSAKNTIAVLMDAAGGEAPAVGGGEVHRRGWKTKSGHSLLFSDEGGNEEVTLTYKDGTNLVLGAEASSGAPTSLSLGESEVTLLTNHPIKVDGKDGYEAKFVKDLKIEAMNITLKATQKLTLEAGTDIEIKAGTTLTAKGNISAKLEGVQAEVAGSAMTTIKGGLVKIN